MKLICCIPSFIYCFYWLGTLSRIKITGRGNIKYQGKIDSSNIKAKNARFLYENLPNIFSLLLLHTILRNVKPLNASFPGSVCVCLWHTIMMICYYTEHYKCNLCHGICSFFNSNINCIKIKHYLIANAESKDLKEEQSSNRGALLQPAAIELWLSKLFYQKE